eukprot:581348-Rhodomonas_salina.2
MPPDRGEGEGDTPGSPRAAVLDSSGKWKEARVLTEKESEVRLRWREGEWGRGEERAEWFKDDDKNAVFLRKKLTEALWLGEELGGAKKNEIWKRFVAHTCVRT